MKKILIILTVCMMSLASYGIYIGYEYAPGKGKVVRINPPIPDKPGVIYPIPANVVGVPRKYLVVETTDGNKSIRVATESEKALIDAPSYTVCYDETSPVWLKWSSGVQTNLVEAPITLPDEVWIGIIQNIRGLLVQNGYNPADTNQTREYIANDIITRSQASTNTEEIAKLTRDGITLDILFKEFVLLDIDGNGVPEWDAIWSAPNTQTYTNYFETYSPICD